LKTLLSLLFFIFIATAQGQQVSHEDQRTKVMITHLKAELEIYNRVLKSAPTLCPGYMPTKVEPLLAQSESEQLLFDLTSAYSYVMNIKKCNYPRVLAKQSIRNKELSQFKIAYTAIDNYCAIKKVLTLGLDEYRASCKKRLEKLLNEIDPYCRFDAIPSSTGNIDGNPCMAGDKLVIELLRKSKNYLDEIYTFLSALQTKITKAKEIDLYQVYGSSVKYEKSNINRRKFLAMMTFFYASTTSNAGFTDRFAEVPLKEAAMANKNIDTIVADYHDIKNAKDYFNHLLSTIKNKKIKLVFRSRNITSYNRHNFMSLFLGCHFRMTRGSKAGEQIPLALGFAYESKDFISHLKNDGVDMDILKVYEYPTYYSAIKRSYDAFQKDIDRYATTSSLGSQFCSLK
jgi:hypothetical protein